MSTGLRPWSKCIKAILDLDLPQTVTELRSFIGAITFYHNMFLQRSHVLAPLTELIGNNKPKSTKVEWTVPCRQAFETAKVLLVRAMLMQHPDHNKPFHIYTDASDYQLGAAVLQDRHPVVFYMSKLNDAQRNYTTIDKELPSTVEMLKEYCTTLYGTPAIHIYTDHSNLTGTSFTMQRILH